DVYKRQVDGLPLGIELAAAWTRMLTPSEIVQEIEQDLDFLSTPSQDLPDRHRSMTAVFDYSWNLLSPIEQRIFCQLGLFSQSFSREAAAQIAGASLLRLTGLVDKSLVQRSGDQRYQLHQLLRRFAEAKLRERPDLFAACRQRHCQFFADFLTARTSDLIGSPRQKLALDDVAAEQDHIRMAWASAIETGAITEIGQLLAGTFHFYDSRSWFREGADTFGKAIAALDHMTDAADAFAQAKTLARLCSRCAWLLNRLGAIEQATPLLDRAMTLFEQVQMPEGIAFVWNAQADIAYGCGDYALAQTYYEQAELGYRQVGYRPGLARVLMGLGNVWAARETDDFKNSIHYYADGLYEARAVQNRVEEARALVNLGTIALTQQHLTRAGELFEQAITACQDIGDRRVLSIALTNLGEVYDRAGDLGKARQMFEHGLRLKREIGHQRGVAFALISLGDVLWKLGERNAAKQHYRDGLQLAMSIHAQPVALTALLDLSDIAQTEGKLALAASILACVLQHPALEQFQRVAAQTRIERLAAELGANTVEQLRQQAQTQSLTHTAALAMTV
ncbi:MAG: tetratricopeptide repeat protein, partial [Anaerolineae bacterium]|nr:tetratricopeptide repeat protein [Anaerolineae bacterium]